MRVFIAGIDGYLGWPLALCLSARGHEVAGADLLLRREWVAEVGGISALPIASREERMAAFKEAAGVDLDFRIGDLTDYDFVKDFFVEFQPEAVVHLGQMPSAPYSMMDRAHCVWTCEHDVRLHLGLVNTKSWLGRQTICQLSRSGVIYVQSFDHRLERNDTCRGNNAGRSPTAAEHLSDAYRLGDEPIGSGKDRAEWRAKAFVEIEGNGITRLGDITSRDS